jgi:hypothetical protein
LCNTKVTIRETLQLKIRNSHCSIRIVQSAIGDFFWDQGYPALMLTDTSFLRNPNYHQSTDTPDTLDYPRMTEVTLGVASAIRSLSG